MNLLQRGSTFDTERDARRDRERIRTRNSNRQPLSHGNAVCRFHASSTSKLAKVPVGNQVEAATRTAAASREGQPELLLEKYAGKNVSVDAAPSADIYASLPSEAKPLVGPERVKSPLLPQSTGKQPRQWLVHAGMVQAKKDLAPDRRQFWREHVANMKEDSTKDEQLTSNLRWYLLGKKDTPVVSTEVAAGDELFLNGWAVVKAETELSKEGEANKQKTKDAFAEIGIDVSADEIIPRSTLALHLTSRTKVSSRTTSAWLRCLLLPAGWRLLHRRLGERRTPR